MEIKVRAWYEGKYYYNVEIGLYEYRLFAETNKMVRPHLVAIIGKDCDDIIIEQYSGLDDINEKEVYAGDIPRSISYVFNEETKKHDIPVIGEIIGVVEFGNFTAGSESYGHGEGSSDISVQGFYIKTKYGFSTINEKSEKFIEIAGNKHQNHELLEKK